MLDYSPLFPQLFELQKLTSRKAELAIRMAGIEAWERSSHLELDLKRSIHSVGGARARFNETGLIEFMSEQRKRDEAVKTEYREVCEKITELTERIDSLIIAAAF